MSTDKRKVLIILDVRYFIFLNNKYTLHFFQTRPSQCGDDANNSLVGSFNSGMMAAFGRESTKE